MSKEKGYIRKTITLPKELSDRVKRAAARRIQCGLGDGSFSGVARQAITLYLDEFEYRTGDMGEYNAKAID